MIRQEWDESGSSSEQLRSRFNDVLDAFDDHHSALTIARQQLAELRTHAESSDRAVRVTVDSSGAVVEIALQPGAMRTTAASLSATLTAVAQAAAQQARVRCSDILEPLSSATNAVADRSELIPGTPRLRAAPLDPPTTQ
ncbi:DNA-binding protein YbaB [Nocardia sp. GAS34]|uniref:YbaB/EbfC family nucleoid-associated protein n=1 Tax=unclassified Nocardia TaxID=2637762 RepID=UPI003D239304